jgi:hypothetical protein
MPITFACPKCRESVTRSDSDAGSKIVCPVCNQKLRVPVPPTQADKTVLGELRPQDNQTIVGEMSPAPAPIASGSPIRCVCPQCRSIIKADPRRGGTRASCPGCGCPVEIPLPKAVLVEEVQVTPTVVSASVDSPAPATDPFSFAERETSDGRATGSRRSRSGPSRALVVAGIAGSIILIACMIGAVTYYVSSRSKPENVIVGRWQAWEEGKKHTLTFYRDGLVESYGEGVAAWPTINASCVS